MGEIVLGWKLETVHRVALRRRSSDIHDKDITPLASAAETMKLGGIAETSRRWRP